MNMGSGGAAADSRIADHFAALDASSSNNGERRKMRVPGGNAKSVIDEYHAAIAGVLPRIEDNAVGRGVHGRAVIGADVNARVERTFTRERVEPLAKAIRDVAENRPDRRRIIGIREGHGGHQAKAARGNSDGRSIALEEGKLLNGAVKGVFRSCGRIHLIEGCGVIAHHAISHGDFGGQGLQGVEPLVGVLNARLQLAILLLKGFLVVAKGVVIPDLPEHAAVRTDGSRDSNAANDGQDR